MRGSLAERDKLKFPYMASPKLDGVRCFIDKGVAYTKSGKPFANRFIQRMLTNYTSGCDGELICGDPTDPRAFRKTSGQVRTKLGVPAQLRFHVFDIRPSPTWEPGVNSNARNRYTLLQDWMNDKPSRPRKKLSITDKGSTYPGPAGHSFVDVVPMTMVNNLDELDAFEAKCLAEGYEGVMLRDPESQYKFGQATVKENSLLKLKRFTDGEARITGFVEFAHNENVAFKDAQGFTKRSSSKAGKRPGNKLGKLLVTAINGPFKGKDFEVGTGFNNAERIDIWKRRSEVLGSVITFRCQEITGGYDLPRIPTFVGFRFEEDISDDG